MNINKIIKKSQESKFGLWKLNFLLGIHIPFNKPHGIKINQISQSEIKTIIPYKRKNFNHIKGIHACGLATASEFASGFILLINLDSAKYRLIMESLQMEYHFQAKSNCFSCINLDNEYIENEIILPLQKTDRISISNQVKTFDMDNNHISTATIVWQIKSWDKVKTKV